jgi:uncharacterized membrane protein YccC
MERVLPSLPRLNEIWPWLKGRRSELRLGVRVAIASIVTYAIAHLLSLSQGYWAVITAVIVIQGSLGGSLKATADRFIGTLAGAVFGAVVAILIPHREPLLLAVALGIAVFPLAMVAALHASFRVAPVTAIIVLISPTGGQLSPIAFTVDRVLEIGLGCIVGLAASLLILPARAHNLVTGAAGRVASLLADQLVLSLGTAERPPDHAALVALQPRVREAMARLEAAAGAAQSERASHLSDEPDPAPLVRTSLRLRHDMVMIARAARSPLDPKIGERVAPAMAKLSAAGARFLKEAGAAIARRTTPPSLDPYVAALEAYSHEIAALRQDGLVRVLEGEAIGRLFTLGFAFEQLRQDLKDLESRASEFARPA